MELERCDASNPFHCRRCPIGYLVYPNRSRGWLMTWLEAMVADFRYSFRTLRNRPMFTVVAACTLALGIGANSAMFSLVDGVLLRPLPFPHAERLVEITQDRKSVV